MTKPVPRAAQNSMATHAKKENSGFSSAAPSFTVAKRLLQAIQTEKKMALAPVSRMSQLKCAMMKRWMELKVAPAPEGSMMA